MRIHVATTLTSLALTPMATDELAARQAFECFTNESDDVTLTLPPATRANIGLEYFYAVNPAVADGKLKILCKRERDGIQIRTAQKIAATDPEAGGVILIDGPVRRYESIEATWAAATQRRTSVVLACRGIGLWVAENVAAEPCDLEPARTVSLWQPGEVCEDD